ncbi:MAG: efflux RND transporter periplasmic adaptor subunit [Alphaproteobacteria bacterium]|nr:efflux RND transporter periplasmic adaptor subunit [Alphaproteobacteria bacterium]
MMHDFHALSGSAACARASACLVRGLRACPAIPRLTVQRLHLCLPLRCNKDIRARMRLLPKVSKRRMIGALAAMALLAACGDGGSQEAAQPAMTITAAVAHHKAVQRTVSAVGTVVAWEEMPVGAEVGGLAVTDVLVDEGDAVAKGQLLARLNDDVLQAQLAQQKAGVAAAQARLTEAKANLQRGEELLKRGHISGQAADARRATADTAAADLALARASLAETQAKLAQTRIVSPGDGYVSAKSAVIGQIVSSGTELFRVVRDSRLELDAEIPETVLPRLKPGLTVGVSAEGIAPVQASIRAVAPSVDRNSRLGLAHIALPAGAGFRPGMFAQASIRLDGVEALLVPQAAVVYRDGTAGVFVVGEDSKVSFRRVQTGDRVGDEVEIESGLSAGARVAFKGAGFLEDGDLVTVVRGSGGEPVASSDPAAP